MLVRFETRHTPAFGVVRVRLAPGEAVRSTRHALVASSFGVTVRRPERDGGRSSAPAGAVVFTAPDDGGWVDLAPRHAGDVYPLELGGQEGWSVARGVVLAQQTTVHRDSTWPALRSLFGGDTGFLEHYNGSGTLALAADGPVDALRLEAGEVITVAPAFLVAYPDSAQCRLRALDPAAPQSVRTGEGLAMDFAGPGSVLVQARPRGMTG